MKYSVCACDVSHARVLCPTVYSVLFHWSKRNVGCLSLASVQWCQTFNTANKPCHGNSTQRPENNALYSMATRWRETAGGQGYWPSTCLQRGQVERLKQRAAKGQSSIIRIARGWMCVFWATDHTDCSGHYDYMHNILSLLQCWGGTAGNNSWMDTTLLAKHDSKNLSMKWRF